MHKIRNFLLGGLLAVASALPMPASATMPALPGEREAASTNVVQAAVVCDRYGCYDTWRRPPPPPRWLPPPPPPPVYRPDPPYYRPVPPPPPYWRYRRPPPPPPIYRPPRSWDNHVRWCLERYRSYNPRTNRYVGYDGYFHVCRSPYR